MANGKWQIECEMRNAKCEMKMSDAGRQRLRSRLSEECGVWS